MRKTLCGDILQDTCHHLQKQLERSNHESKEELVLCLMEMTTKKDPTDLNTDEEWTVCVDRGGLWYIKNATYLLFVAMRRRSEDA